MRLVGTFLLVVSLPQVGADPLAQFAAAVQKYEALRRGISAELPPLVVTDKPAEIVNASDALARAIARARGKVGQGEFFPEPVVKVLREKLRAAVGDISLEDVITPEADERSTVRGVQVHARFPLASPMATMPPRLLAALPPLPPRLEYRLIGTTLVLRDVDAALILDYMPNAVR